MKTKKIAIGMLLHMSTVCASLPATAGPHRWPGQSSRVTYETDGHYWTVLVVATLLKLPDAKAMAYSAEYPDNVINADGYCVRTRHTFMYPKAQKKIHALTGGNPAIELQTSLQMMLNAVGARELGIAAHRLGDSFAHINDKKGRMFPHLIGHTLHWKEPDKIKNNPSKYLRYVQELVTSLGGKNASIDLGVFTYIAKAGLNSSSNAAILKTEYNLLINSIAFTVEHEELEVVENYLAERMSTQNTSYAVHSNTDAKGRVTKTIILMQPGYVADLNNKPSIEEH